jgi:hypothetical protein
VLHDFRQSRRIDTSSREGLANASCFCFILHKIAPATWPSVHLAQGEVRNDHLNPPSNYLFGGRSFPFLPQQSMQPTTPGPTSGILADIHETFLLNFTTHHSINTPLHCLHFTAPKLYPHLIILVLLASAVTPSPTIPRRFNLLSLHLISAHYPRSPQTFNFSFHFPPLPSCQSFSKLWSVKHLRILSSPLSLPSPADYTPSSVSEPSPQ